MTDEFKDISEARLIKPNGQEIIVQTGGPLRPGNVYYNTHMEGDLKCLCCDATSRHKGGQRSRGGSSGTGQHAHFAVTRHQKDCVDYLRHADAKTQTIDRTKGYRLHLNTMDFSSVYNKRSGAYDVSQNGRITISDPDLKDRESFAVNDLKELIKFLNWADPKRLKDTVVIFKNKKLDLDEVLVDMSDPYQVAALADRAHARRKGEVPPFALLKLDLKRGFTQAKWGKSDPVPLEPFDAGVTKANRKREVHLQIYVDNRDIRDVLGSKGEILMLVMVRHGVRSDKNAALRDWLNVKIDDHRQIQYTKFIENAPAPASGRAAKAAPSGP